MGKGVVVRNIERVSPDVIAGLAEAGVATVHEAQGQKGLLDPAIRPIQSGARIAGSAVTVESAPGDNIMVHAAIEVAGEGDVLVVALTSGAIHGMIGELMATSLRAHGCVGAVIDSGVRDTAELVEMGFPVWSRAISAQGTAKATAGSVNVPVVCAGARVEPGDVVVADDDGVVIVEREQAADVLANARRRIEKESETRARLEAGELGVDFYGLRERLKALGVTYVKRPDHLKS
jgi:4-hydroxy-4-methyl-2-oxoglutarate aldolase